MAEPELVIAEHDGRRIVALAGVEAELTRRLELLDAAQRERLTFWLIEDLELGAGLVGARVPSDEGGTVPPA